ncbi:hypothetical protein GGF46_000712 [Coemansia sp. RSA 552]|nr:hypothetical protein GGF46_000712 [Coemansia sp. RSA 552]
MVGIGSLLLLLALGAGNVAGMYDSSSAVKQLTSANFDSVLDKTAQPTFVKFYAPWCGHCQKLEPAYQRAAARTQGMAKFYAVDCDEEVNKPLCARYNVRGFPTLKVFSEKRTKRGSRRSVDYPGARKASAMAKFARSMLPSFSKSLAADELDAFVSNTLLPKAILLTERSQAGELWQGVAAYFNRRVDFAHVPHPADDLKARLGVSGLPAVVVFPDPADHDAHQAYTGETKYLPLARFIHRVTTGPTAKAPDQDRDQAPDQDGPKAVEHIGSQADLERLCLQPASSSPVPILCIIGVLPLEPEFEESRAEHAQAVEELESVLSGQRLRAAHVQAATAAADDGEPEEADDGGSGSYPPLRVAWVNALDAAGQRIRAMFDLADDLPTAVAISPRKSASAPYRGPFASAEILDWADACYEGRGMRRYTFELAIGDKQAAHDEL